MSTRPYHPRLADAHLASLLAEFPAVMVTGARGTGKTTTAARATRQIARLDVPGVAATFRADPDAALRRAARPLLIDEWQEVPEVLAAIKRDVDRNPEPGRFVLTGSVRAELKHETWAGTGRIIRMEMYPVVEKELREQWHPGEASFLERLAGSGVDDLRVSDDPPDIDAYVAMALRGGFPEVVYRPRTERGRALWLTSYLDDVVTRDAAAVDAAKDPAKLRRYVNVLALNIAGMPSDATIYRSADVNAKTAAGYDQLLKNLYVLDVVPAWSSNRLTRLVKRGKRYLIDGGIAGAAAGVSAATLLEDTDLLGRFFDAFAVAQLRGEAALTFPRPLLHHLRVEAGSHVVDLVVEMGAGTAVALEFKARSAPDVGDARHLLWLRDRLGERFLAGAVLHSGPGLYELGDRVFAIPLCAIWS